MLKIKSVTAKNFLSIGAVTQSVNFDRADLTLVIGENLDLGGESSGSRNGVGKTTILNALSYALYGQALNNIKKDNLINKTNKKNMLVTVDFEKDGVEYRIERGRKPNVLRVLVGGSEREITDEAQGDSRETQEFLESVMNMSHTMFKYIVAMNTYTEPFLNLKAADQREVIEQLLGITLLSEKADILRNQIRETKALISEEEYRIKGIHEANERIEQQIKNMITRSSEWEKKKESDLLSLADSLQTLFNIDIESELSNHKKLNAVKILKDNKRSKSKDLELVTKEIEQYSNKVTKIDDEIKKLLDKKCFECGQTLHDDNHTSMINDRQEELEQIAAKLVELHEVSEVLSEEINLIESDIDKIGEIGAVHYSQESEAVEHQAKITHLEQRIIEKSEEVNPYTEQIEEMKTKSLIEVSYDHLNSIKSLLDHQDFLLKLLTNKDSFVRKRIIDQNLSLLNSRLSFYLEQTALPHEVTFMNDLSVTITDRGRDLDFHNLSRGEMTRLVLSMNFAFRDVWEALYQPVNLLFVDEMIDLGLDYGGVTDAMNILNNMARTLNRSVWFVSHREELMSRVNNIMMVTKENGFTTYNEIVDS